MRFGLFWQTPGSAESSVARRHWETIEEIALGEQLGFETAWLAESVFYPTRPMSNPLMVAIAAAQRTERIHFGTLAAQAPIHHPFHMATQSATCPTPRRRLSTPGWTRMSSDAWPRCAPGLIVSEDDRPEPHPFPGQRQR